MRCVFLLAIISLITSCVSNETADSKDVNQSEIYQTYRINWSNGSGNATASFRFGGENGTTLRLSKPSEITFNGQKLKEGKFLFGGAYYDADQPNYSPKQLFRFTDSEGKVYENGYEFERIEIIDAPKKVGKDEDLILHVSRKIGKDESLTFITQGDTMKSLETNIGTTPGTLVYYNDGTQDLIVKPACFEGFIQPNVRIWIAKSDYRKMLEQPTDLPGELHFNFQSKVVELKRVDKK